MADLDRKGIDVTTEAIAPKLLGLAWPLVLGNLLQTAYNIADMFWVGRVGPEAVAAVSLMFPLWFVFVSTALGLSAAATAVVSQYVGAGEHRRADRAVAQTTLLALAASATLAVVGWTLRRELLRLIGAEGRVFVESLAYIEVILAALPLMFLFLAFRAALQGAGDTRTAMWLMVISAGLNVVLDPFLVLGWGPFPAMGTRGAAWATFAARAAATVGGLYVLFRGGFGVRLHPGDLRPDADALRRLVRVGYPASLDGLARSLAAVVTAALVAPFGTAAIAAYGIGIRLMSMSWSVAGAVGEATATGVGQNLGAGTPDRAASVTRTATGGTMAVLFAGGMACVAFPGFVMRVFVDDPVVVAEGIGFFRVVAPFWAVFGGTIVVQGAFRGAGRTKVAMGLSLFSRWVVRVPAAVLLAYSGTLAIPGTGVTIAGVGLGLGVTGIWVAFAVGATTTFLVAVFWFRLGRWAEGVIDAESDSPAPGSESDLDLDADPDPDPDPDLDDD